MERNFGKLLSLSLAGLMLCGVLSAGRAVGLSAFAEDYYAPITATGGEELLGQLHDLITTTHTKYTTYEDCKNPDYVKRTDPGPNGQLTEFYAQAELSAEWQSGASGTWNREHVWCQSLSNGLWGQGGGGSDLLHIRPTETRVNSARGNDKYGEVSSKTPVWYRDTSNQNIAIAGYSAGRVFEPIDSVKGDVARIVLYVYTHYNSYSNVHGSTNGSGKSSYFGKLNFSNVISAKSESEAIDLLLKWNGADPVDALELARNDAAYEIQGNRNPFVDHPEYVNQIWENLSATDPEPVDPEPTEPTGKTITITLSSFDLTAGYGFKTWSADGIGGVAFLFGGSEQYLANQGMQFNKNKSSYYLASDLPTERAIKSVTVRSFAGTADRPWKLLTSDSPYGQVTGKPTNGTDHGTKTVTEGGVTWMVDGDDTYFALTYELSEKSGASYLDSIIIEYEDDEEKPVDPEPVDPEPVDPEPVDPKPAEKGGCGSVIGGASVVVFTATLAVVAVVCRRKD